MHVCRQNSHTNVYDLCTGKEGNCGHVKGIKDWNENAVRRTLCSTLCGLTLVREEDAIMLEVTSCTSRRRVHYVIESVIASSERTNETA